MDEKDLIIQGLLKEIEALKLIIIKQEARTTELEKRLGLNSKNSSKPPSSDGFKKPPRTTSLRKKGKNKSGGQLGHKGHTLLAATKPNKVVRHEISKCPHCQSSLGDEVIDIKKRQVFDIPPQEIEVTEHQAEIKSCACCGKKAYAEFPKGVNFPVQYGPRIKAMAVYFSEEHYVPEDRLQKVFQDLYRTKIATATLVKFKNDLAEELCDLNNVLLKNIKEAKIKNLDETGFRIGGKTHWLHVASNEEFTYYHQSPKRKSLIKGMKGTIVHDHWKPYYQMPTVKHALCNAHHLRELQALVEHEQEIWARKMQRLLKFMSHYRKQFSKEIPREKLKRLKKIYDRIIEEGLIYHEKKRSVLLHGGIHIRKKYPGHNLLLRLKKYKKDVLRFLINKEVPFTNNQAERDLRMMKLRQKISGGFRTEKGAETFVCIRAFISTARKQGWDVFTAISNAVEGVVPLLLNG